MRETKDTARSPVPACSAAFCRLAATHKCVPGFKPGLHAQRVRLATLSIRVPSPFVLRIVLFQALDNLIGHVHCFAGVDDAFAKH